MLRTLRISLILSLVTSLGLADKQFTCPNNGTPKPGADGKPIQCLPGQSSDLICGAGYSCYFSGLNYQCCPTNNDDGHHHSGSSDLSESHRRAESHNEHHQEQEHHEQVVDEEQLDNGAECPDDTFIVLTQTGLPIQCHPRTNPCPQKSMFCNKYSSIPVCCEGVSQKHGTSNNEKTLASSSSSVSDSSLPLIPTPLEANQLQQAHVAPPTKLNDTPSTKHADNQSGTPPAARKHADNELGQSSQAPSPQPAVRTTTLVNHDMGMDGECTANSVIVLADDGKPIECDRNHRCPLDSLLCHKNNNGRSYCCQIVPRDEVDRSHASTTTKSTTQPLSGELKRQEEELAQIEATQTLGVGQPAQSSDAPTSAGGSPPSIQPPGELSTPNEGKSSSFADNEASSSSSILTPPPAKEIRKSDSGGIASIHIVAHGAKTHDNDGINSSVDDSDLSVDAKSEPIKPAETQDRAKVEYRPHNQGGYAVLKKLEPPRYAPEHGSAVNDRDQRKRLAQRFLLDQIKDGWPYDEKFYRGENVVVMNQGAHPAAIVHFPN